MTTESRTEPVAPIEWGFNCLTQGVHHGRPEKIWNLPLIQANAMYSKEQLKAIVVNRIFNDAMQFVNQTPQIVEQVGTGARTKLDWLKAWAETVKKYADEMFEGALESKLDELFKYYGSSHFKREGDDIIERIEVDELNPHYEPLHLHDTINLLCRIIGTSASRRAAVDFGR